MLEGLLQPTHLILILAIALILLALKSFPELDRDSGKAFVDSRMCSKGSRKTPHARVPTKHPILQSDPQESESKIGRNAGNLSLAKAQRPGEGPLLIPMRRVLM